MEASLDMAAFAASFAERLRPTAAKMQKIATIAHGQLLERFSTGGASGDQPWPPGRMPMGKRPPLYGLQFGYHAEAEEGEARVGTRDWRALVHHLGTEGKGGALPDLRSKTPGKVMYIPLTMNGVAHYESTHTRGPVVAVGPFGHRFLERPSAVFHQKPGPAFEGRDFIFRRVAALPVRQQLPSSEKERSHLGPEVARILAGNP